MRFHKLRIAWSVGCGIACGLLIVLWVRSYYLGDVVQWSVTRWCGLQFTSQQGQLTWRRCSLDGAGHDGGLDFAEWSWSTDRFIPFDNSPIQHGFTLRHLWYFAEFPYWAPV